MIYVVCIYTCYVYRRSRNKGKKHNLDEHIILETTNQRWASADFFEYEYRPFEYEYSRIET